MLRLRYTHGIGEHLINMGIHSYSVKVGRSLEASPIAERLECVVDQLNSVACLARAIWVPMESNKHPRCVQINTLKSPNVPPGIQPKLPYGSKNGRAIIPSRPGIINICNAFLHTENSLIQGRNDRHNVWLTSEHRGNLFDDLVGPSNIGLV